MTRLLHVALWASCLAFAGCASAPATQESIATGVVRQDSPFDLVTRYQGPQITEYVPRGMLNDHVRWRVNALTMKTGTTAGGHVLVVSIWHQDSSWRHYRTASFIGGEVLPVKRVDASPSCMAGGGYVSCSYTEVVSLNLAHSQWEAAKLDGLSVRFNAEKGPPVVVTVNAIYANGLDAGIAEKSRTAKK